MQQSSILNLLVFCAIILCIVATLSGCDSSAKVVLSASSPLLQLNIEAKSESPQLTKPGWDTKGTGRGTINLLKSAFEVCLSKENKVLTLESTSQTVDNQTIQYKFSLPDNSNYQYIN